jgi:hypothetical protein
MMQIEVQSSCGKSYNLAADPSTSVYALQKQLAEETGFDIAQHQLINAEGAALKWSQLLSETKLEEQPKLRLNRKHSGILNLKVRIYRRHELDLLVDWESTVANIKEQIFQHTRIPTSQQELLHNGEELADHVNMEAAGI